MSPATSDSGSRCTYDRNVNSALRFWNFVLSSYTSVCSSLYPIRTIIEFQKDEATHACVLWLFQHTLSRWAFVRDPLDDSQTCPTWSASRRVSLDVGRLCGRLRGRARGPGEKSRVGGLVRRACAVLLETEALAQRAQLGSRERETSLGDPTVKVFTLKK